MTDLWVRLCTFLLLLLGNEVEPFSKGEKDERDLKIRDSRRTYGLRANEERKRDREEERSRENGRVNDQGGLLDRGGAVRAAAALHGIEEAFRVPQSHAVRTNMTTVRHLTNQAVLRPTYTTRLRTAVRVVVDVRFNL